MGKAIAVGVVMGLCVALMFICFGRFPEAPSDVSTVSGEVVNNLGPNDLVGFSDDHWQMILHDHTEIPVKQINQIVQIIKRDNPSWNVAAAMKIRQEMAKK